MLRPTHARRRVVDPITYLPGVAQLVLQLWSNPFDMGWKGNWQQVFGPQPLLLGILPSRRPPPPPVVEFFPLEANDPRQRLADVSCGCYTICCCREGAVKYVLSVTRMFPPQRRSEHYTTYRAGANSKGLQVYWCRGMAGVSAVCSLYWYCV